MKREILSSIRISHAALTLHSEPLTLEICANDGETATTITCTNPLPLRSTAALSEPVDRLEISDRNTEGDSREFGRFQIALFVGPEMTERFDCDTCEIERVHNAKHTSENGAAESAG